jgi:hypothetical protein
MRRPPESRQHREESVKQFCVIVELARNQPGICEMPG